MTQKTITRKLLLEVDEKTLDWINDYKYAMLVSRKIVLNNSEVLAEAIQSLKRESEQPGAMPVVPRPDTMRQMEVAMRESRIAGKLRKKQAEQE